MAIRTAAILFGVLVISFPDAPARAQEETLAPAVTYVAVFDFESVRGRLGRQLADSVRLGLRRRGGKRFEVIDKLTTAEAARSFGETLGEGVAPAKVAAVMRDQLAVQVGVYGTVRQRGPDVRAEVRWVEITDDGEVRDWVHVFSDSTERARGQISRQMVEAVLGKVGWEPPEYGDEPEPENFGAPLNRNGDFEAGHDGWDRPDNVSTFLEDGGKRGKVLRIRTNLLREPWLAYRRKLRFGQADSANPPSIRADESVTDSVAALEGVHYRGEWIRAEPGKRYWLTADMKGRSVSIFFPKVHVKGYQDWSDRADAMPELSLVERKMTPKQFAALPAERRKALIAEDAKAHPERYRREVFRWYLACRNYENLWQHYAAPFPPRGGPPKKVQWLQVQIHAYWPPYPQYLFDNVHLYADPRQTAPREETKPRTPSYEREMEAD